LLLEFQEDYHTADIYLRGVSGFAGVMIYEKLESNGITYTIRVKENVPLSSLAEVLAMN
jgi:hypothetical protein